jgi:methylated-DNA-[protein]-cysteine S-methyltransferase
MAERVWLVDRLGHPALPLLIAVDARDDALVHVSAGASIGGLFRHARRHGARLKVETRSTTAARRQLAEYLTGRRRRFELAVRLLGTGFQRKAWGALLEIPYGRTASYGEQAAALDVGAGARAIGQANAHNPVAIVVPCHRVVGSSGKLTGFAAGVETKKWLLELESSGRVPAWQPKPRAVSPVQLGLFA